MNPRRFTLALCLLAAIAVGVLPRSRARAQAPAEEIVPGEILVGVKPEADDGWQAARLTTHFGAAVAAHPALHVYRYRLRQGFSMQAAIDQMRKRPDVLYAEP